MGFKNLLELNVILSNNGQLNENIIYELLTGTEIIHSYNGYLDEYNVGVECIKKTNDFSYFLIRIDYNDILIDLIQKGNSIYINNKEIKLDKNYKFIDLLLESILDELDKGNISYYDYLPFSEMRLSSPISYLDYICIEDKIIELMNEFSLEGDKIIYYLNEFANRTYNISDITKYLVQSDLNTLRNDLVHSSYKYLLNTDLNNDRDKKYYLEDIITHFQINNKYLHLDINYIPLQLEKINTDKYNVTLLVLNTLRNVNVSNNIYLLLENQLNKSNFVINLNDSCGSEFKEIKEELNKTINNLSVTYQELDNQLNCLKGFVTNYLENMLYKHDLSKVLITLNNINMENKIKCVKLELSKTMFTIKNLLPFENNKICISIQPIKNDLYITNRRNITINMSKIVDKNDLSCLTLFLAHNNNNLLDAIVNEFFKLDDGSIDIAELVKSIKGINTLKFNNNVLLEKNLKYYTLNYFTQVGQLLACKVYNEDITDNAILKAIKDVYTLKGLDGGN